MPQTLPRGDPVEITPQQSVGGALGSNKPSVFLFGWADEEAAVQPEIKVVLQKISPKDPANPFLKFATRDPAPVQYIFLNRWALAALGNPQAIEVQITAAVPAEITAGAEPELEQDNGSSKP